MMVIGEEIEFFDSGFLGHVVQSSTIDIDSTESDDEYQCDVLPKRKKKKIESKLPVRSHSIHDKLNHWPLFKPMKYPLICKHENCK